MADRKLVGHEEEPEPKARRFRADVLEAPKVRRNNEHRVTSMEFTAKAPFKGDVTVRATGDLASAYWSITPGMQLSVVAIETGDKEYKAESIEVVSGE